ncbi:hypothetical protein PHYPSEUDO_004784 [Phytophthora pseudosyringae]|uniref:Uncharacterized protein n=1 Tax=Phytophthora pseudosyringae TaxID=221518 RepID=A0A8T1VMK6_9STRA|nr:hypothetical protein PHYPSEUDO_004784 [Phytophthora pseudosyringae]
MLLLFLWLLVVSTTVIDASSTPEPFSGDVLFYRDVDKKNLLGTMAISVANRCYNMNCGHLDNNVSSITWSGLPKTATYEDETRAQVAFYVDKDCTGSSQHFATRWGGVSLAVAGLNDAVSSFMVLQFSAGIENGVRRICELG